LAKSNNYYEVKKGKIYKIITETTYTNPDNEIIIIHQQDNMEINNGDEVFMHGKQLDNGSINFSRFKILIVREGKVVRLERKNPVLRLISKTWKKMINYYYE
jgi:hypothetical protein